ncbi:putative histone acetyltransferase chromatin regulator PHD family [Dioscorea sansibarensis]
MNTQAHMSGHISGQVPNQASQQFSGLPQQMSSSLPSQIQNFGGHSMDPELYARRREVQEYIFRRLQKRSNSAPGEFVPKLSEIAKRLEEYIYRDATSKEDYINMNGPTIDQRLQSLVKTTTNNSQLNSHHFPSSSAVGPMIPTPGMVQNSSTSSLVGPAENVMNASNAAAMVVQTTSNTGNSLPIANGLGGVGNATSFNISDGQVPNGYRKMTSNASLGSGVTNTMSSVVPQPPSQMIPTPGLNNFKPTAVNPDFSNAGGLLVNESSMVSQQLQHKHYVGSQASHIFHSPGAQMGGRMRPNMPKPSPYGFPNGRMNGGLGLTGAKQLVNGPAASEGYLSAASYGSSPKPAQEHFDQQHHQPMVPASLPSQTLSMTGDGYAMTSVDVSGSGNLYGQVPSAINHQNANPASLNPKSKISPVAQSNNGSLQSMQQSSKPQTLDQSQSMDFQTPQSIREHLVQSQHQLQNLQHQQFQQQSSQPYSNIIQNQQQAQQQLMTKTDSLRQSLMISNLGGQLVSDHGNESHDELLLSQTAEQFQLPEVQNHWPQRTSVNNRSESGQSHGRLSSSHYFQQSVAQDLHNPFPLHQQTSEFQNDLNCLTNGSQPDSLLQSHWRSHPSQKSHMLERSSLDQQIKEEFNQRIAGQGESQQSYNILEGFKSCSDGATKVAAVQQSSGSLASGPGNSKREQDYYNQQRWLLFLIHARACSAPKGACKEVNCVKVQQLWSHIKSCKSDKCAFPRCIGTKKLYQHYTSCRKADCPVCKPVRAFLQRTARSCPGLVDQMSNSQRSINATDVDRVISNDSSPLVEASKPCADPHSLPKRMKTEHIPPALVPKSEASPVYIQLQTGVSEEVHFQGHLEADPAISVNSEIAKVNISTSMSPGHGNPPVPSKVINGYLENAHKTQSELEPASSHDIDGHKQQETIHDNKELDQGKIEQKYEPNGSLTDCTAGSKSGKPKIKGVSLTELFTPEQVREHIIGLRQWVGQSKAKAEKNQAMEHSMSENSCQLCAVEKLTFEPPPIYCSSCGARIKRNATYYTVGTGDSRHYFCIPCYNEARGDTIEVDGSTFPKSRLDKKRNDEETEEWWVQCDKCEAWQHQICALFNGRRNDGGQAEYTCPNCYIGEVERGERMPLPQNAVLGAKDLPRTLLSDHIEQRLFRRLKQERQERARHLGKSFDEVPGAEALVVRVVSSVDKKLEVKQRFLEIFQEENYPTEFPYKSKVVLLFQKIEGVEVCLFGMYVQEFGSECQFPNQRRVYLSYLDSVKYFRPEIKAVTGEALRTFVYHEILIGYLEYCKKRGFTSCYIWACPPLKGEDYILYCHPEIQKTPKSDKLREWYLSMLRKASKENIVADLTNLYDHFFVTMGECKAKPTAARLPYFDGDYWPGAAEDMINQLRQEEDGRKQQKKGKTKKLISKRALKAAGQADLSGNASKDALLMQKLGETIYPMKEDFIMVHLQHACTHCCLLMISGTRWVCNQCKNFQLCDKCHDGEQRLDERERHPINSREAHMLYPVEINDVPSDTKDKDEILESEFFDTRQAFLSLCQGNHYQYDTLRRAKHSSMMVLYHLHNPTAPAFVTTCNVCHQDIETGQGWRCEICPDFDVCNACNQKNGGVDHPHKLTNHPSMADRDAQNKEARQKRVLQLRKMLDLLVHASQCRFSNCQYPNCRKVKGLFRHGMQCKKRVVGGCPLCKKVWYLLQLHARACKESECHVPRCKDLKEHLKRLQQQSDSRRRAAVMEMMRQRAAEVAGNTD